MPSSKRWISASMPNTDNMRYDAVAKRLYVGYGAGARAALAVVDPAAMERVQEFKVGSHPESFQLEAEGPRFRQPARPGIHRCRRP